MKTIKNRSHKFQITWYKNDAAIHEGPRFSLVHEGNFHCVDVVPVTVEDQGRWACMAENRSGRSSCTCILTVVGNSSLVPFLLLDVSRINVAGYKRHFRENFQFRRLTRSRNSSRNFVHYSPRPAPCRWNAK